MPEGDTLYALAARLRPVLAGKTLRRTDFRVPRLATVDLAGWRVDDVRSVGKHLLIDLSHGERHCSIRSHLGMDGSWRIFTPGQRWTKPGHTARVVLRVDAMVPDALQITASTDATGHLETTVLDQTDTDTVTKGDVQ